MTLEEQKAIVDSILANHTDQAQVSTNLATLVEDYKGILTDLETTKSSNLKLTEDNEKIRQANFKLFEQIGEVPKHEQNKDPEDTTPKFESLFDENGNLL
jgi:regulator of replication initiation timing